MLLGARAVLVLLVMLLLLAFVLLPLFLLEPLLCPDALLLLLLFSCRKVEYAILKMDPVSRKVRVSTRAAEVVKELQTRYCTWSVL